MAEVDRIPPFRLAGLLIPILLVMLAGWLTAGIAPVIFGIATIKTTRLPVLSGLAILGLPAMGVGLLCTMVGFAILEYPLMITIRRTGPALFANLLGDSMGVGTIVLGVSGCFPDGLPFGQDRVLTGGAARALGLSSILLGIGLIAFAALGPAGPPR